MNQFATAERVRPQATIEDVKRFWSENPMAYFQDASDISAHSLEAIDRRFREKSVSVYTPTGGELYSRYIDYDKEVRGKKVLEIGYGFGTMFKEFSDHGADLYGIDLSTAHFEAVLKRMHLQNFHANVVCGNAEALP